MINRWLRGLVVSLLLALGATLLAVRLLVPQLEDYRPQLEAMLGQRLGLPLRIQGLAVAWQGWQPVLELEGLSLHPPGGGAAVVSVTRARLALDVWSSLLNRNWTLQRLSLEGPRLVLERLPDGRVVLLERGQAGGSLDPEGLLRTLLAMEALELKGGELLLRPGAGRPPLVLRSLILTLGRSAGTDGHYRRLGLEARLPDFLGERIRVAARLRTRDEGGLEGDFYLDAPGLKAAGALEMARLLGHSPHLTVSGGLDLELWGKLAGWTPRRLVGRTAVSGVSFGRVPYSSGPPLPDLAGNFRMERVADGWISKGDWRMPSGGAIALDLAWGGRSPTLLSVGRRLPLELARSLAPLLGKQSRRALVQLDPTGRLALLTLALYDGNRYRLAGRLEDLSLTPGFKRPGLKGLSATVTLDPRRGSLTLAETPVLLAGGALAAPVALLPQGRVEWQRDDQGLTLTPKALTLSSTDLSLALGGQLYLPSRGEPRLDLSADFQVADLGRLGAYLPVGVIKPGLVDWLDSALVAGRVSTGRLVLQGRPRDLPFQGQGLRVRLAVEDATLAYHPLWPPIRNLQAQLELHDNALTIRASRGRLMETVQLAGVEARIVDLRQAVLTVRGRAAGPGQQMLAFLANSPLWQRLETALERLTVSGDTTLDLELVLPLDRSPPRVTGSVDFDGNRVSIAGTGVVLERVRGPLDFTGQGVFARDIRLDFRGDPARLAIDTRSGATQFRLAGDLGPRALGQWALPYLEGHAPTQLTLMVARGGGPLTLTVDSTLRGMAVNLPPPLGKPAAEPRPVAARAQIQAGDLELALDYGEETRAALAFSGLADRLRLERGEVRINAGPARLPDQAGVDLVARLGEVRWPLALPGGGPGEGSPLPPWLNKLDIRAARLVVGNYRLDGVVARLASRNDGLYLELAGEAVAGQLRLPATPDQPMTIALDHLWLEREEGLGKGNWGSAADPRHLPPLALTVADLRLEGRSLGALRLNLKSGSKGVRLDDLELESPLHKLVVRGQWQAGELGQLTQLNLNFSSHDLSDTLARLGLEPGLEAGEADLAARLEWPGPLFVPDPSLLSGQGELQVGSGRLSRLEPGVARMMGLFSLASLTRRLALDFSDLFREGLAFDSIDGAFTLKDGQLLTDNLIIEGPAADIGIRGRIGLADRDQQLQVTVLPQM
ncbi:MAG: YhdP family protein, partial [Candidatus Competibacteraceae bacterium]|nr:YhdP family protein [Candidatus Competibacteraceae bacterium]